MIEIILLSLLGLGGIFFSVDDALDDDDGPTSPARSGEEFEGDNGPNVYEGTAGDDLVNLNGGDDTATLGDGNDEIRGGAGNDVMYSGADTDVVMGGDGDDLMTGGGFDLAAAEAGGIGFDLVLDDNEVDTLDGGAGNDMIIVQRGDIATGGEGEDTFGLDARVLGDVSTVTDFVAGEDTIVIDWPEESADPTVAVEELTNDANEVICSTILVNGTAASNVTGGQTLTPADIAIIPV